MSAMALNYSRGYPERFVRSLESGCRLEIRDFMLTLTSPSAPLSKLIASVRDAGAHARWLHLACSQRPASDREAQADSFHGLASLDQAQREYSVERVLALLDQLRSSEISTLVIDPPCLPMSEVRQLWHRVEAADSKEQLDAELLDALQAFHAAKLEPLVDALCRALHQIERALDGSVRVAIATPASLFSIALPEHVEHLLEDGAKRERGYWHRTCAASKLARLGLVGEDVWLQRFGSLLYGVSLADCLGVEGMQVPGLGGVDFARLAGELPRSVAQVLEVEADTSATKLKFGYDTLRDAGLMR